MNKKLFTFLLLILALLFLLAFLVISGGHGDYVYPIKSAQGMSIRFNMIENALFNFLRDVKRLPKTHEGLNALKRKPLNSNGWKGPYVTIKELDSLFKGDITKDVWGTHSIYIYPPKYGTLPFDLYSCGQNKKDDFGEGDDISNWKFTNQGYYVNERIDEDHLGKISAILVILIPFCLILLLVYYRPPK